MTSEAFDRGLDVREDVLGEEYVEAALARNDLCNEPLQELVTEFCWGKVRTREGLPRKVRSPLNIATMVALNRPEELKIHVRGALKKGCTREEVGEALLQTAVYAGIPAAIDGFRVAWRVMADLESDGAGDGTD